MYVLQVTGQVVIRGGESAECLPSGNKVSAEPESNNLAKQVEPEKKSALKEKKVSYPHPHVKLIDKQEYSRISKHALQYPLTHTLFFCNVIM